MLTASVCARACRPAVTLVSRRWQRVFYAEPDVWRSLQFSYLLPTSIANAGHDLLPSSATDWLASKLRLTKRVASLVTAAAVYGSGYRPGFCQMFTTSAAGEATVDILQLLQPSKLMELAIPWRSEWPEAVLHAAARLTGLTKLQLSSWRVPQAAAITLRSLPHLCSLELTAAEDNSSSLPDAVILVLPQFLRLTSLNLRCARLPQDTATTIASLTQLCSLSLKANNMPQAVLLALPSLPRLVGVTTVGLELRCQYHAPPATAEQLSAAVCRLPRLHSLHFSADRIPQQLVDSIVRLTQLTRLGLESAKFEDARALQQLTGLRQLQQLQLTIAARRWQVPRPAAIPCLQSYRFSGAHVFSQVRGCGQYSASFVVASQLQVS